MSWSEYYCKNARPFAKQVPMYEQLLGQRVSQDAPLNWALGGYHPYNSTVRDFLAFVQKLNPHGSTECFLLDKNPEPGFVAKKRLGDSNVIRARLEELPFQLSSIDVLINDFTLDFMSDRQIAQYSSQAVQTLNRSGWLVVASMNPSLLSILDHDAPVEMYPRSRVRVQELLTDFICIDQVTKDDASVLLFQPR